MPDWGPTATRGRPGGWLDLNACQRAELLAALAAREIRRPGRTGVRWVTPGVAVLVDAHGSPTGPVRAAIVRAFAVT